MRWIALLLSMSAMTAHAANNELSVSVASGSDEPVLYTFPIDGARHELDLRESHTYSAAFKDPATKRDICRAGEYKTGLLLKMRLLPVTENGAQPVEVIGQVSTLAGIKDGISLPCGVNQELNITNTAFSDTVQVERKRTKVVVVDGTYAVMLKTQ